MKTTAAKITKLSDASAALVSPDPATRAAASAYFARRNRRAAREAGRPLSPNGVTARIGRSA